MGDHVPLFLCVARVFPAEKKTGTAFPAARSHHCWRHCARGRRSFGLAADEIARAFAHDFLDAQDAEDAKGYLHGHGEVGDGEDLSGQRGAEHLEQGRLEDALEDGMQEEEREAVAGQEIQGQHFPVHAFQQFQHPGTDAEFLHIVGTFDIGHEAAEVMVGHDEQGGQHGRHADGAEVAADEGHAGVTVAGAVHAHEEDGHEEAEVAQGRDQQARHHQGQDGSREQDLLQQPGGQMEDERPDAEHGHDEGDVPVGHQTGRSVGQTAQDVPQGGHGRAVVDEGDVVAEPVVGDPARSQQEQRKDEIGAEDVDDLGLVETQGGELAFPAVHEVEQIAGDEDEVDGGGVEKA